MYRELRGSEIEDEINPKIRDICERYLAREDQARFNAQVGTKERLLEVFKEMDKLGPEVLAQRGYAYLKGYYVPGARELLRMMTLDGRLDRAEWERRMGVRFKDGVPEIDKVWRESNKVYEVLCTSRPVKGCLSRMTRGLNICSVRARMGRTSTTTSMRRSLSSLAVTPN